MSQQEQSSGYVEELDAWINEVSSSPLYAEFAKDSEEAYANAAGRVQKAVREKVLESYRNGQVAGPH